MGSNDTMKFHLGDILSITTGVLCLPNGIDGVYEILNFMTGDDLYTSQLPRVKDECEPYLREQFPEIATVTDKDLIFINLDDFSQRIDKLVTKFGAFHEVRKIHPEDHQVIDPRVEVAMKYPHLSVVTINEDENGEIHIEQDEDTDL